MQQLNYVVVSAYYKDALEQLVNDRLQDGWRETGGVSVAIESTEPPNRKALYFYTQAMTLITDELVTEDSQEKVDDS